MFKRTLILILLLTVGIAGTANAEPTAPSGTIAFVSADGKQIRQINGNGSSNQLIWQQPDLSADGGVTWDLAWKPNGSELGFVSSHESACSILDRDIFAVALSSGLARRITYAPGCDALGSYPTGSVSVTVRRPIGETETVPCDIVFVYVEGAPDAAFLSLPLIGSRTVVLENVADFGADVLQQVAVKSACGSVWNPIGVDVLTGSTVTAATLDYTTSTVIPYMQAHRLAWRPDGAQIALSAFNARLLTQIAANPAVSAEIVNIPGAENITNVDDIAWSPDGTKIAYSSGAFIYLVTPADNSDPELLLQETSGYQTFVGIDWLPDGSGLIASVTGGEFSQTYANLLHYDLATKSITFLTNYTNVYATDPSVAPDGQYIAFTYQLNSANTTEIYTMRSNGTETTLLVANAWQPRWKPESSVPTAVTLHGAMSQSSTILTSTTLIVAASLALLVATGAALDRRRTNIAATASRG